MRMEQEITLRDTVTAPNANGTATATNTDKAVFADKKSVRQSEFYAAQSAGVRADVVFVVKSDEYDGQMLVVYDGVVYKVSRTFQNGRGRVELTCTKR